ncbi:MAG: hypothetical protein C0467_29635 [Planctomycetaceae bacterium]|nr:hypothetical protein [Planctomycetaceae bacterium]
MALDGTPAEHPRFASLARIATDFAGYVADPRNRDDAKCVLVRGYFTPAERVALAELVGIPAEEGERLAEGENLVAFEEVVRRGRESRFRLRVVAAYNYTCALTGYRLTTVDGVSVVDAAHIHRFADSGNNDPRNGLALSKNAHWMFDEGLWTLADDLTVDVADAAFAEAGPDGLRLLPYRGRRLAYLPGGLARPSPSRLAPPERVRGGLTLRAVAVSVSAGSRLMSNAFTTTVPPTGRVITNGSVRAGWFQTAKPAR